MRIMYWKRLEIAGYVLTVLHLASEDDDTVISSCAAFFFFPWLPFLAADL